MPNKTSKQSKRHMKKENPTWTQFKQVDVPKKIKELSGEDEVWVNSRYQVGVRYCVPVDSRRNPPLAHLSIKRLDKKAIKGYWRDFQRIKNELCGTACEAVQLFPCEKRLVDTANQYHLFCLPPGVIVPFGYPERLVSTDEGTQELLDKVDKETKELSSSFTGARQLEFEAHHNAEGCSEFGVLKWQELVKHCSDLADEADSKEGSNGETSVE